MPATAIAGGSQPAIPCLIIRGTAPAFGFYKMVFSATELFRMAGQDGGIRYAGTRVGDSQIRLADEMPGMGYLKTQSIMLCGPQYEA